MVISVIATLGALAVSDLENGKRVGYVLRCRTQMQEFANALVKYRNEHNGHLPTQWDELVPKYCNSEVIVCPFTKHMAPEAVKSWQQEYSQLQPPRLWSTYTYFQPDRWDELARTDPRGMRIPYSEVLKKRGADTPMLICRDHREPYSLDKYLGERLNNPITPVPPPRYPHPLWNFPEDDIVVARWGGKVDTTKKGGTLSELTFRSTSKDLLEL